MGDDRDGHGFGWRAGPDASPGARMYSRFLDNAYRHHLRYGPAASAEEVERRRRDHWWELGPVFSTTDRGAGITALPPGREPGRLTPALLSALTAAALLWTAAAHLAAAELPDVGTARPGLHDHARTWWWIALAVLAFSGSVLATARLRAATLAQYRQQSVAAGLTSAAVLLGITAGAGLHLAAYAAGLGDGERFLGERAPVVLLLVAAPLALVCAARLAWAPYVLLRAGRRQRQIQRLRDSGRRFEGVVDAVRFRGKWSRETPLFEAVIGYEHAGVRRTFPVAMATGPDRVPVPGFPVRIMVDERSATLVEPDVDRPGFDFETDCGRYVKPTGDG